MKKVLQHKIALLMYSIFFSYIVSAQNTPPVVNAGVDQMILLPSSASLSGM
ncbi:MAG: hypothetical protein JNJ41_01895 [Bacteroidia bacterium]|nr:hypothetical protein [Bacteroidia bacterium]